MRKSDSQKSRSLSAFFTRMPRFSMDCRLVALGIDSGRISREPTADIARSISRLHVPCSPRAQAASGASLCIVGAKPQNNAPRRCVSDHAFWPSVPALLKATSRRPSRGCSVKNRQKPHPTPTIVMESGGFSLRSFCGSGASTPYPDLVELY